MSRKSRYTLIAASVLVLLSLIVALLPGIAGATNEETRYEYNRDAGTGNATIYANNWYSQSFTTTYSHTVSTIVLPVAKVGNPYGITVSIRAANATGVPIGDDLVTATPEELDADYFSTDMTWRPFAMDTYRLAANTTYCIVIRGTYGDASNYLVWEYSAHNANLTAPASYGSSTDGGATWSADATKDFRFELWGEGTLVIWSCEVYGNYLESNDKLFAIEYLNICPPYYDDYESPTRFFALQLIDMDGSTVLATVPCRAWQDRPAAIYLSATQAASLTQNGNYTINLQQISGGSASGSLTLTSANWKGNNYTFFDEWVISTAKSMEDYDGGDYVTTTEQKEVLTQSGGAKFIATIPGIVDKRPGLFLVPVRYADLRMTGGTVGIGQDWEVALGTDVVASMTSSGGLLGITAKEAATVVVFLFCLASLMVGAYVGNVVFGLVIGAIPLLVLGTWLGIISASFTAVVTISFAILIGAWFWWQST